MRLTFPDGNTKLKIQNYKTGSKLHDVDDLANANVKAQLKAKLSGKKIEVC